MNLHKNLIFVLGLALGFGATACDADQGMALLPRPAATLHEHAAAASTDDGIPITFTLDKPGYVTLVIEDAEGRRVRNLTANTLYPAGTHTVYWDEYDLGRAVNYSNEGGAHYDIERHRATPGTYQVRGLVHEGIRMYYALSVQSPGTPPWHTHDGSGAWLSDHGPPLDVLALPEGSAYGSDPQVMVSAHIAEVGHGLMWLGLDGQKRHGKRLGWEGAYALARDLGPDADPTVVAYALSVRHGTLTLVAHKTDGSHETLAKQPIDNAYDRTTGLALAVYNQRALVSFPLDDRLELIDLGRRRARTIATLEVPHPKGLLADETGRLYVIQDQRLVRYDAGWQQGRLGMAQTLIDENLEDPRRLARDAAGTLYVSDWGTSHQVKVFAPNGQLRHTIGEPGGPQWGRYDAQRMHHPNGLAIDSEGRLWVAELDYAPKRLILWTTTGTLIRAFYGPPRYGGGGTLNPADSTRFFYATAGKRIRAGIAFALDWETGETVPHSIYRRGERMGAEASLPFEAPTQPIHVAGRTYLVNTFNQAAHGMRGVVGIWLWDDAAGTARLVSVVGFHGGNQNRRWTALDRPDLVAERPARVGRKKLFYTWSDLNGDGEVQPDEVQYATSRPGQGRVSVGEDLAVLTSWMQHLDAPEIDAQGVPRYDIASWQPIAPAQDEGEGDVLRAGPAWVIRAGGPLLGFHQGDLRWTYHTSYFSRGQSPTPAREPGQLVETSRVLGLAVHPRDGEAGPVWALNNDKGSIYLFTADGLLLQELGGDARVKPLLRSPSVERGQALGDFSFNAEHFWPTLTQHNNGTIYLAAGKEHTSLFRLEGFGTVERRDFGTVTVLGDTGLPPTRVETASLQQARQMTLALRDVPLEIDGSLDDWADADWIDIDAGIAAAATVDGDRLYVAYQTDNPDLLDNDGAEGWPYLFATGGGLDVLVQAPQKAGKRNKNKGSFRLFVTRLGDPQTGPIRAVLFRKNGRKGPGQPLTYTSDIDTVAFAGVADVSDRVALAQAGGVYELSIPLPLLELAPEDGLTVQGDLGILIGDGVETRQRVYWSNKTATMVSDLPTEARLQPRYWGTWVFSRAF